MQLYLNPQLFLTNVSFMVAFYLFITSLVTFGLQSLQFYTFGSPLPFIIAFLHTIVFLFALSMSRQYADQQDGVTEGHKQEITSTTATIAGSSEDSGAYKFKFLGNTEFGQRINDPKAQKLKNTTMLWVSAEIKLFIIYNIIMFVIRASSALESEVDFTDFVEGYIQATESAFYKGKLLLFIE